MYDNAQDAQRYLGGTVVYWKGEPHYVDECRGLRDGTIEACLSPLPGPNHVAAIRVNIADPDFNCMKYKLGYVNMRGGTVAYVSRRPARIQSQGLCGANLSVLIQNNPHMGGRAGFANLIGDPGFVDTLKGKYPSIKEARERLLSDKTVRAVAFDPRFCIKRHRQFNNLFFLNYKGDDVAYSDCAEFSLPSEFQYLFETCSEKGCLKAV